jgi:hypothetical protein
VQLSADTERSATNGNNTGKSLLMPYFGTVRITYEIRSVDGNPVTASLSTSGSSALTDGTSATSYQLVTHDIRVLPGATVSLSALSVAYACSFGCLYSTVAVRNFRASYDALDFNGQGVVLAD